MLILAGISISMLSGDNSILKRATNAKEKYSDSSLEEQVKIATIASITNGAGKIKDSNIRNELKKNLNITDDDITGDESLGWHIKVEEDIFYISPEGSINRTADRTRLKVGDYVDYSYVGKTVAKSTTVDNVIAGVGTYTNYLLTSPEEEPQTITAKTGLKWRILSINENGSIELTCEGVGTEETLQLQGARGYNNGVLVLNNLCKELFAPNTEDTNINKNIDKITVRSITIEDVEKHFKSEVLNGNKVHNYVHTDHGIQTKYGGNGKIAGNNEKTSQNYTTYKNYPALYEYEKYAGINSTTVNNNGKDVSDEILTTPNISDEWKSASSTEGLTVTETYYTGSFTNLNTKNSNTDNGTDVYEILYNSGKYWIASRCALCGEYAFFGIRAIDSTWLREYSLLNSRGQAITASCALRPVISLGAEVKIEPCEGTNSDNNMHKIQ